jgi:hypothetical protein
MHSSLSLQSCLLPQAWFPMMRSPAAVEVAAASAAEVEAFTAAACAPEDFMVAARAPLVSGAALFMPDASEDMGLPGAAMDIVE